MSGKVRRDDFAFKLSAAKYHQAMIQATFSKNKPLIIQGKIDLPNTRPFVYHYYSLVYELYSCIDLTLHFVNEKLALDFQEKSVRWKNEKETTKFQNKVKSKNPFIYSLIKDVVSSEWYMALQLTRNYIIHNGIIGLQVEYNNNTVNIINPIIKSKILHFDLNLWGEEISKLFNEIYSYEPTSK